MFDIGPNLACVIIAIACLWAVINCVEASCYKDRKDDDDAFTE